MENVSFKVAYNAFFTLNMIRGPIYTIWHMTRVFKVRFRREIYLIVNRNDILCSCLW